MKCSINLRNSLDFGGISNYIQNISRNLPQSGRHDFTGCTFWRKGINKNDYNWFPGVVHETLVPERLAYHPNISIPYDYESLMNVSVDFNIFFTFKLPNVNFKSPIVSTIHDIILLRTKTEPETIINEHLTELQNTINNSEYVLTVSDCSKKDLIEYFNLDENRIFIVHNGIDYARMNKKITTDELQAIKRKYSLPDKYILNFGIYRKHKNLERLIEAYALLPKDTRRNLKLVFTCNHPSLNILIEHFGLREDVINIGFIPNSDKPAIFHLAQMIYYASIYEGFGVPILEAQAAGIPVITSNISALPEAAGDGAILVNPYDVYAIRDAIQLLYLDKDIANQIVSRGRINASQYTWQKSAEEFISFLDTISVNDRKSY